MQRHHDLIKVTCREIGNVYRDKAQFKRSVMTETLERFIYGNNYTVTCDYQQCGILTCADSDKPVQPPLKLRNSKWCSVNSLTIIEYSSD